MKIYPTNENSKSNFSIVIYFYKLKNYLFIIFIIKYNKYVIK